MSIPPNIPIPATQKSGNTVSTAGGQDLELVFDDKRFSRDLLDVLKPGEKLHGRVVEKFANGSYLFTIRGRNMIASSQVPLMRDSVVAFEVLQTKDGIHIRLANPNNIDSAQTSSAQKRLAALHLPNNSNSQLVLQAFEQQGAPLQGNRLQQALQAIQQAPAQQAPLIAASHALLAKHGLPATPALVQLAQTAISPSTNTVQQLQQVLQQLPPATHIPNTGTTQTQTAAAVPQHAPNNAAANLASTNANATPLTSGTPLTAPQIQAGLQQHFQLNPSQAEQMQQILKQNGIIAQAPVGPETAPLHNATNNAGQTSAEIGQPLSVQQTDPLLNPNNTQELKHIIQDLAQLSREFQQHEPAQTQNDQIKQVLRELSADSIFKPQHLHDYDNVLPLVMQHQGETQQARIAIAKRPIPGQQQEATFLRVDMELQQLGPLSLRMSSGHGPIVITLFATGNALDKLEAGRSDLIQDLEAQHIEAHIRIADLLEHEEAYRAS